MAHDLAQGARSGDRGIGTGIFRGKFFLGKIFLRIGYAEEIHRLSLCATLGRVIGPPRFTCNNSCDSHLSFSPLNYGPVNGLPSGRVLA